MKELLAIEWLKIKRYRTFWVLTGFFIVLLPLLNYQILRGMVNFGGSGGNGINLLSQSYSFPAVWGNLAFWGSIFIIFLAILVIILTTNEFTFKTHRQNIIDGLTRLQFYHAKVYIVIILSLSATLYLFLLGICFGYNNSGSFHSIFSEINKLFYFFLLSVNYLGFALLIGLWIRRSGLAIGLFLLYALIIENILSGLLNWTFASKPGQYLPLQASDDLLPLPLMKLAKDFLATAEPSSLSLVLATICWCTIYYFAGRNLLLKSDW